jgi:site-specific recombinase XerD
MLPKPNTLDTTLNLTGFAQFLTEQDRSPTTIRGYIGDVRLFARWFAQLKGNLPALREWSSADVRQYRQTLSDAGAKPQTINRKLAAVAAYGHWAVQKGLLENNPAESIRSIESVPLAPKWLDKKQRAALVRAIENDLKLARQRYPRLWLLRLRDAAIVTLMLNTGLRVGEVCALKLDDVQISERKATLQIRSGKGRKQRSIPINASARAFLVEWLKHHPGGQDAWFFVGQRGEPLLPRSVQRAVKRYADDAELDEVTPHTLRHTFAKTLIDEGVELEKIAALLGHSNLNTTRIYTVPGEDDLNDAVRKLDE